MVLCFVLRFDTRRNLRGAQYNIGVIFHEHRSVFRGKLQPLLHAIPEYKWHRRRQTAAYAQK